jgi:hypothetical protein
MKTPHRMNEDEMDALSRRLAWPGFGRNDEQIDKVLATLPEEQAIELMHWIERARQEFEEDYEEMQAEMSEIAKEHKAWKTTEQMCKVIKFPLGGYGDEA